MESNEINLTEKTLQDVLDERTAKQLGLVTDTPYLGKNLEDARGADFGQYYPVVNKLGLIIGLAGAEESPRGYELDDKLQAYVLDRLYTLAVIQGDERSEPVELDTDGGRLYAGGERLDWRLHKGGDWLDFIRCAYEEAGWLVEYK